MAIPTRNRSALNERSVRSALAQTYADIEVLVSDDASTDDTQERLRQIKDPRLVVFHQPQALGLTRNFDFCLRHASGEYFLLLGDDDALLPEAVQRLAAALQHPPDNLSPEKVGFSWCPCRISNVQGMELWRTRPGPAHESAASFIHALWTGKRGPRLSGILYRTADALAVGGFEQRHGDICDMGLFGRLALLRGNVVCVNEFLVQYTNHHGSITSQSAVSKWRHWARAVHADLVQFAQSQHDADAVQRLEGARREFLSGITLTVMMQTIGRPGWIAQACREALRSPAAFFTPYVARRLFTDGWKLLRLRGF